MCKSKMDALNDSRLTDNDRLLEIDNKTKDGSTALRQTEWNKVEGQDGVQPTTHINKCRNTLVHKQLHIMKRLLEEAVVKRMKGYVYI